MSPLVQGKSTTSTKQNTSLPPLQTPQEPPVLGKNAKFTLFSPQNPIKNGDTSTLPKQKICPIASPTTTPPSYAPAPPPAFPELPWMVM